MCSSSSSSWFANIGGALSPLGDPSLFIGFLRRVEFTWTARHLWLQTVIVAMPVLVIFFAIEMWRYSQEPTTRAASSVASIQIRGRRNILLIVAIVVTILAAATWNSGITIGLYRTGLALENVLRNATLIVIAFASLTLTREEHRDANNFTFGPMIEVAILFAGIFVAIVPVIAMLQAGVMAASPSCCMPSPPKTDAARSRLFWLTGILSGFLDNAPTYLVFFELAGGDARELTGSLAGTLAAISIGAAYMGALSARQRAKHDDLQHR